MTPSDNERSEIATKLTSEEQMDFPLSFLDDKVPDEDDEDDDDEEEDEDDDEEEDEDGEDEED